MVDFTLSRSELCSWESSAAANGLVGSCSEQVTWAQIIPCRCLWFKVGWTKYVIAYSQKYWRFGSKASLRKYWPNLNLVVVPCIVLCHNKQCACVCQGVLPSSCLRYFNNAVSSQIYKKYNWQCASVELYRGALGGAKSAITRIMSLCVVGETILADFSLAVSTLTTKLPNLNFSGYMVAWFAMVFCCCLCSPTSLQFLKHLILITLLTARL